MKETTGLNSSTGLSFKNITNKNINWTNITETIPSETDNAQGFIAYGGNGGITNLTIDSCHLFNNILGFSEAMALDGNINGFTIRNCFIHDNTNIGIDIAGNYLVSSNRLTDCARNGIISNNICYKNISLYATSAGIYIDGGKNVVIEKNKCYENGWGIEVGCEEDGTTDSIIVKNNLIFNNEQVGLAVGGYNSLSDGTGEISMIKASTCIFENNIFNKNSQEVLMSVDNILPQEGNVFNYNCWFTPSNNPNNITVNWKASTYSTFSAYQAGTAQESNSIFSNPILNNPVLPIPNLHLESGGPCIDAGNPSTLISVGETDFDGNVRIIANTIDMGGFEFNSTIGINNVLINASSFLVYPNPFSNSTTISTTTELKNASLKIYSILG